MKHTLSSLRDHEVKINGEDTLDHNDSRGMPSGATLFSASLVLLLFLCDTWNIV